MTLKHLVRRTAGFATLAAAVFAAAGACAQAIERNLPPAPQPQPVSPAPANITPANQDATPIGPALSGLIVLGPTDALKPAAGGVDVSAVKRLDNDGARALLRPFLGRPLSRKLIGQIEAAIARYYRGRSYPFVSLSTPEQNITSGVLQVRVVEFHVGAVKVKGARHPAVIRDGVRLQPGETINADQLGQDLDWLNRYPYRHVTAVFSPGDALGQSDLTLQTTESRPFRVYGGYSDSGSPSTRWDRYFVGASVGGLLVPGSLVSYQFTASPDFYSGASNPSYVSHGVRFLAPTAERQDIEGVFDAVEINTVAAPFTSRQTIDEFSLGYRSAISNFISLPGDITGGIETKTFAQKTFFHGVDVIDHRADVYQAYLGYADAWSDWIGRGDVAVTAHYSPGGVDDRNTSSNLATSSAGRIADAQYAYVNLQADETFLLPAHWAWSETLIAQYGTGALPQTEQMAVGGQSLVRGYSVDDGSFDNGFVVESELHAPPVLVGHNVWSAMLAPFAFCDFGQGWERTVHAHAAPASVGAGFDSQLTAYLTASVDYARTMASTLVTRSGDQRVEARVTVSY